MILACNPFEELEIIENIDFNEVDKYDDVSCVCLCFLEPHIILMIYFFILIQI